MTAYTSIAVLLFCAIALVIPSGFSIGATLLLLASPVLLWAPAKAVLKNDDYILIGVFVFYFLIGVVTNLIHGAPLRDYDAPLRLVLAIPAMLLLLAYPPRSGFLWSGLAVGASTSGLLAGWENLALGNFRAGGYTNPIQFGNISLTLGVLCLAGLSWARSQRSPSVWTWLLIAAAGMGILGSLFSGSRGSWLSLPLCLVVLYRCHGAMLSRRYLISSLIAIIVIFAILYAVPRTGIADRIQQSIHETQDYLQSGNANNSAGARLEMWRMGLMMFPERPWLGWGKAGYMERTKQLIGAGQVSPVAAEHSHLHNEYLDALVKRGIPGLFAVLALFLIPFWLFARYARQKDLSPSARACAIGGLLICVSYIGFGLTQAFLTHNNGVMIYAFMTAILWAGLRSQVHTA
ncbi:MAG: ligase [Gallionellales bacterium RBG_16_56_9]|nr:MAG: ligase [Gallionellales bacterium RBG_16_56_9]